MHTPINRSRYLKFSPNDDWNKVLHSSLQFLRGSWASDWVGVPWVLEVCIEKLLGLDHRNTLIENILNSARIVAINIESISKLSWEPDYHNRLHFCDALTGLCILLSIERERSGKLDEYWTAILLLTVVAHDYRHPGGRNNAKMEIENQTVQALEDICGLCLIDKQSCNIVMDLIRKTDPACINQNHSVVFGQAFDFNKNWATILVNEVDILASCTSEFGPNLSIQLIKEFMTKGVNFTQGIEIAMSRKNFLNEVKFSSPASHILNIEAEIQAEVYSLI